MPIIYQPTGKAREYSPLALNVYNSCDHGCSYCYARTFWHSDPIRKNLIERMTKEISNTNERKQVLLSFISDPYGVINEKHKITREVIKTLLANKYPVAVLTKGGERCLQDMDLFVGKNIKIGATLTFLQKKKSVIDEPNAATPDSRLKALRVLHSKGVTTWASIEPVIDPEESLSVMSEALPFLNQIKIGRLNHRKIADRTDWKKFGIEAVTLARKHNVKIYVKDDLRVALPNGFLKPSECEADSLALIQKNTGSASDGKIDGTQLTLF